MSRSAVAAAVIAAAPDLLSARVRAITDAVMAEVAPVQAELSWRAHHDPLTGLANRSLLDARLAAGGPLGLLVVDLDEFKPVNDTYGHGVGDALLRAAAVRLRGCVRSGDLVARLGGDEFAVVATPDAIDTVASHVAAALTEPYSLGGLTLTVGASVGVAVSDDPEGLLRRADAAMYRAKRAGKGRVAHDRRGLEAA